LLGWKKKTFVSGLAQGVYASTQGRESAGREGEQQNAPKQSMNDPDK